MGLFTTFRWVPSTMSRITKLKPQVDGLPFFRNSAHGRPLQAKRSRWPVFVARHQKNHPIAKSSQNSPVPNQLPCPAGRERVRYTECLARSMGSDDDMFRIWSGPEGSSHKEPLSGIRIHRAHGRFLVSRHGPAGGEVFGVSLVLGFACGIARLPNISPPAGPRRPKITRKGAFI